jgi:DNA-binding NarL/FixJ family response regulator
VSSRIPTVGVVGGHAVKILVAEGNDLLAEAIADLFAEANDGQPVLTARSVAEAVTIVRHERPDLVLLDHRIGRENVESAVRDLRASSPRSAVIVITTGVDDAMVSRMEALGARCVEKDLLHEAAFTIVDSVRRK